jgi:hypothetical protein
MIVPDKLVVQDASRQQTLELDGNTGDITAGGNGKAGDLRVNDTSGRLRVHVGLITETGHAVPGQPGLPVIASYWGLKVQTDTGTNVVQLGRAPVLKPLQQVGASTTSFILGGGGYHGIIEVTNNEGQSRVRLGKGDPEDTAVLELRNAANQQTLSLEPGVPAPPIGTARPAGVLVGGHGTQGNVLVFSSGGDNSTAAQATVILHGNGGHITLKSNDQQDRIFMDGTKGDIWLGGKNENGDLMLFNKDEQDNRNSAKATVRLAGSTGEVRCQLIRSAEVRCSELTVRDANLFEAIRLERIQGTAAPDGILPNQNAGRLVLKSGASVESIVLDGDKGDIMLANADCAEDFDLSAGEPADPGTVMVLGADGSLRISDAPYDTRVAGVISGAGSWRPGLVLDRQRVEGNRVPLALVGKVFCKVDADYSPVMIGDLLTTSLTPGHAMKAAERSRAFGAVIGKALQPLPGGRGLLPILVCLQ